MIKAVKEILSKQLRVDIDEIQDDSLIMEDLGADSLDMYEMLSEIETNLNIIIPDEEINNLKTVKNVADYLESRKK